MMQLPAIVLLIACAAGCERNRRMEPDEQIGLITECEQARRTCMAASAADRAPAIARWVTAIQNASGLCMNDFHDALVMMDDPHHEVALQALPQVNNRALETSFLSDLGTDRLTDKQRARVFASLEVISGQHHGNDRAAWETWLRGRLR